MNLQENIQRIKSMMGLREQIEVPKKVTPSFWDNAIDFFLPGKPVEDGYDIINKFSDIIKRRIDYNKKNNLPLDKMTKEEINYRTTILNATPNYGYPDALGFLNVIKDIKSGKDIRQDEFARYKNMNKSGSGLDYTSIGGSWCSQSNCRR